MVDKLTAKEDHRILVFLDFKDDSPQEENDDLDGKMTKWSLKGKPNDQAFVSCLESWPRIEHRCWSKDKWTSKNFSVTYSSWIARSKGLLLIHDDVAYRSTFDAFDTVSDHWWSPDLKTLLLLGFSLTFVVMFFLIKWGWLQLLLCLRQAFRSSGCHRHEDDDVAPSRKERLKRWFCSKQVCCVILFSFSHVTPSILAFEVPFFFCFLCGTFIIFLRLWKYCLKSSAWSPLVLFRVWLRRLFELPSSIRVSS